MFYKYNLPWNQKDLLPYLIASYNRVIPYQITQKKKIFPVQIIDFDEYFTHKNFDPIHRAMQNFISVLQIVSEIWIFKLVTPWTLSRLKFRLFLCRF